MEDGSDMLIFSHSHQDPSSAVLYVLEPLEALARGPDEKCIAVIQPRGDKGVDQLFSIRLSIVSKSDRNSSKGELTL